MDHKTRFSTVPGERGIVVPLASDFYQKRGVAAQPRNHDLARYFEAIIDANRDTVGTPDGATHKIDSATRRRLVLPPQGVLPLLVIESIKFPRPKETQLSHHQLRIEQAPTDPGDFEPIFSFDSTRRFGDNHYYAWYRGEELNPGQYGTEAETQHAQRILRISNEVGHLLGATIPE